MEESEYETDLELLKQRKAEDYHHVCCDSWTNTLIKFEFVTNKKKIFNKF